jgi:hypothetical protein
VAWHDPVVVFADDGAPALANAAPGRTPPDRPDRWRVAGPDELARRAHPEGAVAVPISKVPPDCNLSGLFIALLAPTINPVLHLGPTAMKLGILLTLPALLGSSALAAPSCPGSEHEPRSYGGEVRPPSAPANVHFSFIADVEVSPDCNIRNIRCISNMHETDDLAVRWLSAKIDRFGPWNRLPAQVLHLQEQDVPGYDPVADPNAPIEYTQRGIIQPATIYHTQAASNCAEPSIFESTIETAILGAKDEVIEIKIAVTATLKGPDYAHNRISYMPRDIRIAIDRIPDKLDFEAIQLIQGANSSDGAEWKIDKIGSLVAEEQHRYFTEEMLQQVVFSMRSPGEFLIPVVSEKPPEAADAWIAAIDGEGHMLATGLATIFLPQ